MPSLTFVLPHWLYWSGLVLFPLAAMYIVRRRHPTGREGAVNLPTAYLFWITAGFVGIHRFYLRSLLGLVYIPLFIGVLFGNVQIRDAREAVSEADNQVMIAQFDLETAREALEEGREGAGGRLSQAETALERAQAAQGAAAEEHERWNAFTRWIAVAIAALLLVDALLLPGMTRRVAEREHQAGGGPHRVTQPVRRESAGAYRRGHPADRIDTPVVAVIDRVSGYAGEFVAYWSLIAVFIYYYEVLARYVFNSPTNWAHESMFLMFGMQYLLSGAFTLREDSHVRVDVIYLMLSDRLRAVLNVITSVFFFLFTGALLWTGWTFAADAIAVWEVSFTEWAIQYWPVKIAIPLGALLILLQGLATLIRDVLYLSGKEA